MSNDKKKESNLFEEIKKLDEKNKMSLINQHNIFFSWKYPSSYLIGGT